MAFNSALKFLNLPLIINPKNKNEYLQKSLRRALLKSRNVV